MVQEEMADRTSTFSALLADVEPLQLLSIVATEQQEWPPTIGSQIKMSASNWQQARAKRKMQGP